MIVSLAIVLTLSGILNGFLLFRASSWMKAADVWKANLVVALEETRLWRDMCESLKAEKSSARAVLLTRLHQELFAQSELDDRSRALVRLAVSTTSEGEAANAAIQACKRIARRLKP